MDTMTRQRAAALEWTPADRMRKAMDSAGIGVGEVADRLEVSRNTVSTWINGRHMPRYRDLRDLADLLGVTIDWIETGHLWTDDDEWESVTGHPANEMAPAEAEASVVRLKGLEPPTF